MVPITKASYSNQTALRIGGFDNGLCVVLMLLIFTLFGMLE